jgi:hypothetical protein
MTLQVLFRKERKHVWINIGKTSYMLKSSWDNILSWHEYVEPMFTYDEYERI